MKSNRGNRVVCAGAPRSDGFGLPDWQGSQAAKRLQFPPCCAFHLGRIETEETIHASKDHRYESAPRWKVSRFT